MPTICQHWFLDLSQWLTLPFCQPFWIILAGSAHIHRPDTHHYSWTQSYIEGIASPQVAFLVAIFGYRIIKNLHVKKIWKPMWCGCVTVFSNFISMISVSFHLWSKMPSAYVFVIHCTKILEAQNWLSLKICATQVQALLLPNKASCG